MRFPVLLAAWLAMTLAGAVAATCDGRAEPPSSRPAMRQPDVGQSLAARDPAALCETAVTAAEYAARLPAHLLRAISLTESGRTDPGLGRVRAWPWTINAEGQGQFFATKQDAVAAASRLLKRGVQSIDVGCLQVNLLYHPNAFASLNEAFDPAANARYAAKFLNALHADSQNWAQAIGAYHSETPSLSEPYRLAVMARWQDGDLHMSRARTASGSAYRDFIPGDNVYSAFATASRVYGAFAPR